MFLDSQIAAKFSCSETKYAYTCTIGLAPFFTDLPHHEMQASDDCITVGRKSEQNH